MVIPGPTARRRLRDHAASGEERAAAPGGTEATPALSLPARCDDLRDANGRAGYFG
jgi:hypothetical protein